MAYRYLDWDSSFFGKKIYQINAVGNISVEEWSEVVHKKPDLIYLSIETPSPDTIQFIENKGGILYDNKVTYYKAGLNGFKLSEDVLCGSATFLSDDLERLTYQSGTFSRFNADPYLSHKFKDLYKEWIVKSLDRNLADEVLVAKNKEGRLVGFVTLAVRERAGSIGLLAVDENFRGQGIGGALMKCAENFFIRERATEAKVITQLDNLPACRLYEKMGYSIIKKESIFHCYLKNDNTV